MIDRYELEDHIFKERSFRIGTRGICCDCRPSEKGWYISIPRAFVYIECDDIAILDDPDYYMLAFSIDNGRSYIDFLNLMEYDKLTVIM